MKRKSVPFSVLEVRNVAVLSDSCLRHQSPSTVRIYSSQRFWDIFCTEVHYRSCTGRLIGISLDESTCNSEGAPCKGEPCHVHVAHVLADQLHIEHFFTEFGVSRSLTGTSNQFTRWVFTTVAMAASFRLSHCIKGTTMHSCTRLRALTSYLKIMQSSQLSSSVLYGFFPCSISNR